MKHTLEEIRKLAVKLLVQGKQIKEISKAIGYSKRWIHKWHIYQALVF